MEKFLGDNNQLPRKVLVRLKSESEICAVLKKSRSNGGDAIQEHSKFRIKHP